MPNKKFDTIKKLFSLVWNANKITIIYIVIIRILMGSYPIISIYLLQRIIEGTTVFFQTSKGFDVVSGFLLLQFVFSIGNSCLSNTLKLMNNKLEYDLNYFLEIRILEKTSSVPLAYFDNHHFHDHQQRASNNLGNRLITPINNLLDSCKNFVVEK